MSDSTITLRVPGAVYFECFDPMCTDVPKESGWPAPEFRTVGLGRQMRYTVPVEMGARMLNHAQDFGSSMSFGVDPETAVHGRRVTAWVERERKRLGFAHGVELVYDPQWWREDA